MQRVVVCELIFIKKESKKSNASPYYNQARQRFSVHIRNRLL